MYDAELLEVLMVRWILAAITPVLLADAAGSWTFSSDLLPPDLTCEFSTKDQTLSGTCSAVKTRLPVADGKVDGVKVRWIKSDFKCLLKRVSAWQPLSPHDQNGNNLPNHQLWSSVVIVRHVGYHLRHRAGRHCTLQVGF